MNELLGFLTLSLPILVPLAILAIGLIATWLITKLVSKKKSKIWIIGIFITIMIIGGDEIIGRTLLYSLCTSQGGITVHNRVELPNRFWNENGIIESNIEYQKEQRRHVTRIGDNYLYVNKENNKKYIFNIEKIHKAIKNEKSNEIYSELIYFRYWGGWLVNILSSRVASTAGCPKSSIISDFKNETFIKDN